MLFLNALAAEARAVNALNGWGEDFDPETCAALPGYLALIHSEITEAWTAENTDAMVRELGDVIVRALDLSELIKPGIFAEPLDLPEPNSAPGVSFDTFTVPHELLRLHMITSEALERYRKEPDFRADVLDELRQLIKYAWLLMEISPTVCAVDPAQVIGEILTANRARGYRHGGRRT